MSDTVTQKVIAAIAKTKKIAQDDISLDSTFEELKVDSLDGLNVFFELEEIFDIDIPDDRAREMRSVRDVVEGLEKLLAERAGPSVGLQASS